MNHEEIANLRTDYERPPLLEETMAQDPVVQFADWFETALKSGNPEPNAMSLGTAIDGKPSVRIVLLKGFDERGFVFFTNYESKKATALEKNPHAALTFFWSELSRQIRIEGTIDRASEEESDKYYHSRPLGSRIGAWASPQSQIIETRGVLEDKVEELEDKFEEDEDIPRPPFWGGYRLRPNYIEFWQGRPSRLHDRLIYKLSSEGKWHMFRLAP